MKKIIVSIIRVIMPKAVRQHEREEKARRIHNANVMQDLLDNEHELRDRIDEQFNAVYTTKEALRIGRMTDTIHYNSNFALQEADFR